MQAPHEAGTVRSFAKPANPIAIMASTGSLQLDGEEHERARRAEPAEAEALAGRLVAEATGEEGHRESAEPAADAAQEEGQAREHRAEQRVLREREAARSLR